MIRVPNRDVLAVVAHSDQRAVRFFEELTASANASEAAIAGLGTAALMASGWGAYVHTGATQVLAAGVKVTLDNNAGSVIETQKPADIATFYDGSVITGREGDGVAIGVELTFTPSSGAASLITVAIDIGGAVGELYVQEYTILHGSGVAHKVAYVANAYQLDTWEANGGLVKVVANGPGDVTLVRYVIQRLHKALP